jgi:hypothetical protein
MPEERNGRSEVSLCMEDRRLLKNRPPDRGWLPARLASLPRRPAKSAAGTLRLRPRFVDVELAPAKVGAVQGSNCAVRLSRIRHLDEGKAACAARVSVGYKVDALHFAIRVKECAERRFGCTEIQISYKDVFHVVNVCLSIVRARRGRFGFGQVAAGRSKASFQCTMRGPAKRRSGVPPNISKLRQHSCAERHEKHSRCKDQYHGTYTPVEELIATEGHCRSFPPDRLYGNVILLNKNKST